MNGQNFWDIIVLIIQNALAILMSPPRGTPRPTDATIKSLGRIEQQLHEIVQRLDRNHGHKK